MLTKLGVKIAEGGCAEVFEWENNRKIIKLAKANTNIDAMTNEYKNNLIAWDIGLSVAEPIELLEFDGRAGIVFERIDGESLMVSSIRKLLVQGTKSFLEDEPTEGQITARVLREIHSKSSLAMSSQRDNIKHSIRRANYLLSSEKETVVDYMDRLPIKQQLCHGDPNPGNILIRDGIPVVIDWMDASIGNPEADIAEYILMIRYTVLPPSLPREAVQYFDSIREAIISQFIDEYMQLSTITYEEIDPWILPIAARKLSADAITEEEKQLLVSEIRRRLHVN